MDDRQPPVEASTLFRRVAAGAAWAQVSRLAEVSSSLLLTLILIRALGPARFGQYTFLVNVATVMAIFLSLGFPETVMRFVSVLLARDDLPQIRFLMRRLVLTRTLVYAIGILVLFAFQHVAAGFHLPLIERYWQAIALLFVSQGAIEFATSYAYARLRSRDVAIARTIGQIVAVLFFAIALAAGFADVTTAAVTAGIAYLAAAVMLVMRGFGDVLLRGRGTSLPLRPIVGFAIGVWATTLFTIGLAGQIDVVLLGALRQDPVQIALYSIATLVFIKLGTLLSGWAGTATSSFADIQTRRGDETSRRLFGVYLRLHILLSMLVYPPLILVSDQVTDQLFGTPYVGASRLMAIFGAFWLLSSLAAAGVPYSILLALGSQRQVLVVRAGTGALNVILDVLLIPSLGALGAIISTGVANAVAHLSELVILSRQIMASYPLGFGVRVCVCAAVGVAPGLLIAGHGLAGSELAAFVYLALFAAGLFVLRPFTATDVELAARLNPRAASLLSRMAARSASDD